MKNKALILLTTLLGLISAVDALAKGPQFTTGADTQYCQLESRNAECLYYDAVLADASIFTPSPSIQCTFDNDANFQTNFELLEEVGEPHIYNSLYLSVFKPKHGPELNSYAYKTLVTASKIATRTHVGTNYKVHTNDGTLIDINHVTQTHVKKWFPVGFYGTYKNSNSGVSEAISCEYIHDGGEV